jgi:hypothetical protein
MNLSHQNKYKVFMDEAYKYENELGKTREKWRYYELHGKFGMIYAYSHDCLGVQVKAGNVGEREKRSHPNWKIIQNADDSIVFKVKNSELDEASRVIRAKKRRKVSQVTLDNLKKYQFKSTGEI